VSNIKLFTILAVLLSLGLGTACTPPQPVDPGPTAAELEAEAARKAAEEAEAARKAAEEAEAALRRQEEEARRAAEQARLEAERRAAEEARQAMLRVAEEALKDINFDYNRSEIRRADRVKFQAIAEFMKAFPDVNVRIESHCDERGTIEYNMALGERRAFAAKSYLAGLGIDESRFSTLSFGKEKPKEFGSSERSWLVNRRCEFKVQ
jgi:peptidoglycan-associated lipoprotein